MEMSRKRVAGASRASTLYPEALVTQPGPAWCVGSSRSLPGTRSTRFLGGKDWEQVRHCSLWIMDSRVLKYTFLRMFSRGYRPSFEPNACLRPGWGRTALPLAGPGERGLPAVGTGAPLPHLRRLGCPKPSQGHQDPPEAPGWQHRAGVSPCSLAWRRDSRDPEPC